MTPKENAIELVEKFKKQIFFNVTNERLDIEEAKGCALIAVQELIDQCWSYREIDLGMSLDYWEEVKQEIEKL